MNVKDENKIAIIEKYNCNGRMYKHYTIVLISKATSILFRLIFKLVKDKKITKNGYRRM